MSKDHILLILKIMGKFPELVMEHKENEEFWNGVGVLIGQLKEKLDELNSLDMMDLLFWLRKLQMSGLRNQIVRHMNFNLLRPRLQ